MQSKILLQYACQFIYLFLSQAIECSILIFSFNFLPRRLNLQFFPLSAFFITSFLFFYFLKLNRYRVWQISYLYKHQNIGYASIISYTYSTYIRNSLTQTKYTYMYQGCKKPNPGGFYWVFWGFIGFFRVLLGFF